VKRISGLIVKLAGVKRISGLIVKLMWGRMYGVPEGQFGVVQNEVLILKVPS